MDFAELRQQARVGNISQEYVDWLKDHFIREVLDGRDGPAANALWAYASFLNHYGINSDNYPLFLIVIASNNMHAVDALLEGHEPEKYLDCVIANPYIIRTTFETFNRYKANELYEKSLRVFLGFLFKVYSAPEEGYQLYPPSIADINSLGKLLDESQDQDHPLNRGVLDCLACFQDLDKPHETDVDKKNLAAQAGRIRSDFFDAKRRLVQSITEVILEKAKAPTFGIPPDHVYG